LPDPQVLAEAGIMPIARGLAASPGAAVGRIVLDGRAIGPRPGSELVLVRAETSAEDVEAMRAVAGILTAAGGLTSHAAVVARAMGKPCVTGATSLHVDYARRVISARSELGARELEEGDTITIDGARGLVYAAAVPVEPAPASEHVEIVLRWADELRGARVLAEAPSERLARVGMSFGADGIVTDELSDALFAAAGEGALWLVAASPEAARAAIPRLRPGRDVLLTRAPDELAPNANGVTLGALARAGEGALPRAAVILLDVPDAGAAAAVAEAEVPEGALLALRGEGAIDALAKVPRAAALVVPPLDVAVGRLCAARAGR
ncbi:MAG TPA: PEP-utilizing enzyme, partial [Sandaracinaceae bacterium]